jgi:hypothetical protein
MATCGHAKTTHAAMNTNARTGKDTRVESSDAELNSQHRIDR